MKERLNNPIEIVCYACSLMRYWAGLYAEGDKERLVEGVNFMLKIVTKLISKTRAPGDTMMQIQEADRQEDEQDPSNNWKERRIRLGRINPFCFFWRSLVCLFCKVRLVELSIFFFCFNLGVGLFPYSCLSG